MLTVSIDPINHESFDELIEFEIDETSTSEELF